MKIGIVGGGVAGVACALALTRQGFEVSVHERHAAPRDMGAGVILWPNAAYVLEQLGVLDEIREHAGHPVHMQRFDFGGETLGTLDIRLINTALGYPSLSILRRDLMRILIDRLKSTGCAIRYAHAVAGIEMGPTGEARVRFADGRCIQPDLVIGADGRMASHARRFVNGHSSPIYQGFVNWVGVCESDGDAFDHSAVLDYWGTGERFGIVPISRRKAYWAAGLATDETGSNRRSGYRQELRALSERWPGQLQNVMQATPLERINKIYVHDHDPVEVWHRGNVLMVGDAAHAPLPTSGQGACQALEDAWFLACCLKPEPRNLQQALTRFTRLRIQKTAGIIRTGRLLAAELFSRDVAACQARNERSKHNDFAAMAKAIARGWGQGLPIGADQAA